MSYNLRPYQQGGIDAGLDFIFNKATKNGLIVAPTGGGKSLYVANLVRGVNAPTLCLQPSKELLYQNYFKYISYGGEASIYSASMGMKEISDVTFATPLSVVNNPKLFNRFKHIFIDESHLGSKVGGSMHDIVKAVKPKKVVGLTATPIYLSNGFDGAQLKMMNRSQDSFFKEIIHVTQIQELVQNNYWAPLIYENRYVDTSMLKLNSNGSEFTDGSLLQMYEQNNTRKNLLEEIDHLIAEGRKSILVFVPSIQEAEELAKIVPNSACVSSKTPKGEREDIVNRFKQLDIQIIFNVKILGIGFDHPQLDAIIMANATNSIAIYYQFVGRTCRIHVDKKDAKIIDLSGNSVRFGKVEDLSFENLEGYGWGMFSGERLLSGTPMGGGVIVTKSDLLKKSVEKVVSNSSFSFGKYSGKTFEYVFEKDIQYLVWLSGDKFVPSFDVAIKTKENVCKFLKSKVVYGKG